MTATLATAGRTPKTSATIDPTMADVVAPDVALLPAVLGTPKAVQAMETTAAHARVGARLGASLTAQRDACDTLDGVRCMLRNF